MFTADQLVAHAVGDFVLQSHWMATEKVKRLLPAVVHALTYAIPFLLLRPSPASLAMIVITHCVIDRWRLARLVVYAKNTMLAPWSTRASWAMSSVTGYSLAVPPWLAVWLLIVTDTVCHVAINGAALRWL